MGGKFVIAYIDDILIYSHSLAQHVSHVRQVLACLLHHQLYIKAEKYAFHQTNISFLGYIIGLEGVRMEAQKVDAIASWPVLKTFRDLQQFLGSANFLPSFHTGFQLCRSPPLSPPEGETYEAPLEVTLPMTAFEGH